jgi:DNA-binding HxlR family transcriptional regulator
MPANITNEYEMLRREDAILGVLRNLELARFNEILEKARVSSRTLSKHLERLVNRGLIQKEDREYRITKAGVGYLSQLPSKLEKFRQHKMRLLSANVRQDLQDHAVEVTRISASETCIGIIRLSVRRERKFSESSSIDRALTVAMRTIRECVPPDCEQYNVTISGTKRNEAKAN